MMIFGHWHSSCFFFSCFKVIVYKIRRRGKRKKKKRERGCFCNQADYTWFPWLHFEFFFFFWTVTCFPPFPLSLSFFLIWFMIWGIQRRMKIQTLQRRWPRSLNIFSPSRRNLRQRNHHLILHQHNQALYREWKISIIIAITIITMTIVVIMH